MPRAKPWLKMWGNWVDEPSFLRMTMAEQTAYWRVYVLAHRLNAGGHLVTGGGSPLSVSEIAATLRLSSPNDLATLTSMLQKMAEERVIITQDGALFITGYEQEQSLMPSSTAEAVRERQRLHRQKLAGVSQDSRDKESNKEIITTTTNRAEQSRAEDTVSQLKSVTASVEAGTSGPSQDIRDNSVTVPVSQDIRDSNTIRIMAELTRLYTENLGEITSPVAEELRDFVDVYRGPIEWLSLAFGEAIGKRSWRYIRKILEDWVEKGGPSGRAAQKLQRAAGRVNPGAGDNIAGRTREHTDEEYRREAASRG